MSTQLANEVMQIVEDLDASQLKLEKNAFDVINSSDTSLNLVRMVSMKLMFSLRKLMT